MNDWPTFFGDEAHIGMQIQNCNFQRSTGCHALSATLKQTQAKAVKS
jgi:hypothetical protein